MDLNKKPVVPAADFLNDSDSKEAFLVVRNYMMEQALWDEVSAAAALKFNVDLSKLDEHALWEFETITRVNFVKMLDEEALIILQDKAINTALAKADRWERLARRTKMSVAYLALKRQSQRRVENYDTFQQFLFDKLDMDPSEKSAQEAVFLLEYIQMFEEKSGNKGAADTIFSSEIKYGKIIEGLPEMREKYMRVVNAERQRDDHIEELNKEAIKLRKQKSKAVIEGAPVDQIEEQIKKTETQMVEVAQNSKSAIEKATVDFQATSMAVAQLAKDPSVSRGAVKSKIANETAKKIEQMGHNPKEISGDYENAKTKPVAYSIHNDVEVIVMIRVPKFYWRILNSALKVLCDIRLSTFDEGMKILKSHMNPSKSQEVPNAAD